MRTFMKLIAIAFLLFSAGPAFSMSSEQATQIITNAYNDILGRGPDPSGMSEYRKKLVDEGWSEKKLREALKNSVEFKTGKTDTVIQNAYLDLLGREPDDQGQSFLREKMLHEGWNEQRVRSWIKKSTEYKQKNG